MGMHKLVHVQHVELVHELVHVQDVEGTCRGHLSMSVACDQGKNNDQLVLQCVCVCVLYSRTVLLPVTNISLSTQ